MYWTRWLEIPDAYYANCSDETQQQIGTRITELKQSPYLPDADYDATYPDSSTAKGIDSGGLLGCRGWALQALREPFPARVRISRPSWPIGRQMSGAQQSHLQVALPRWAAEHASSLMVRPPARTGPKARTTRRQRRR